MSSRRAKRRQKLDDFSVNVQSLYKSENHMVRGSSKSIRTKFIPSRSFDLDLALGGGWKVGGFHLLWGWEHSGKTWACLSAAAEAQTMCSSCHTHMSPKQLKFNGNPRAMTAWRKKRMVCMCCGAVYHSTDHKAFSEKEFHDDDTLSDDLVCALCDSIGKIYPLSKEDEYLSEPEYISCDCGENDPMMVMVIDTEGTFDPEWAERIGLNLDDLIYERPEYGEAAIDVARSAISEGLVDVLIFDSFANISTVGEMDASMEDSHVGTTARKMNSFMRQIPALQFQSRNKNGVVVTVYGINQVREKIGIGAFGGHTMFGGHGQKFAATTITKWGKSKDNVVDLSYGTKTNVEFIGVSESADLFFHVGKNKQAPTSGRKGKINLSKIDDGVMRAGRVNDVDRLFKCAKKIGVIDRPPNSNKGWLVDGDEGYYFSNEGDLKIRLHNDSHFKRHTTNVVIHKMINDWSSVKDLL